MKRIIWLTTTLVFISLLSYAGGYQVRLQGQKQNGMGLIGTSMNFGASSIFYNPGALSMMKTEYSFDLGSSIIKSHVLYQSSASSYQSETDNPLSFPSYFYGATKLSDRLTLGLGFYTPYGSTSQWPDDWAGNNLIQKISLQAFFIQPTISYKFTDKLSFGVGLVLVQGNVDLKKALPYSSDSYVNLKGSDFNIGFNAGLFYQATEKLSIGLDYRSQVKMNVNGGQAVFYIPESLESIVSPTNTFSAELPLPANLDFGISYQITDRFLAALEVNYVMWSVYKELSFEFEENGDLLNNTNKREYSDTFIPRIGLEYVLNDMFTFRGGAYYDSTPTNPNYFTPETVSLDTYAYTFGISIQATQNLGVDLTYLGTHGIESEKMYEPAQFGGTYKTAAAIFGFGINYNF